MLILDDFAIRDFTLSQADDLYELIGERGPTRRPRSSPRTGQAVGLVSAVPEPRRRRVDPRSDRELRAPHPHGRPVLPAQQTAPHQDEAVAHASDHRHPTHAQRPRCDNPAPGPDRPTGRPHIYCSPQCRPSRPPPRAPLTVDIHQDDNDETNRRSWTVRPPPRTRHRHHRNRPRPVQRQRPRPRPTTTSSHHDTKEATPSTRHQPTPDEGIT